MSKLLKSAGAFRPLIALLLFTGVRLGEALGLTWADVDPDGFLRVRQQLSRSRKRVPLKTAAGRRDIVLMSELALILKEHRMASRFKRPDDFVFAAPDGRGRDHWSTSRTIRRAIDRAKLRDSDAISAHTFRHCFASMLIVGMKADPVTVAKQLGHSDPATTLRVYAHEFEKARTADALRGDLEQQFGKLLARRS